MVGSKEFPIPRFTNKDVKLIAAEAQKVFSHQDRLLKLIGPTVVVGDLHGNLHDLLRIIRKGGNPEITQYLFLGDYVDRGQYSIEVVILLFAFACQYPRSFFLLRGNHEFRKMNSKYGFRENTIESGYSDCYEPINEAFDYMPIAAIINHSYFCVHGGISSHLHNLEDIEKTPVPLPEEGSLMLEDLLWSDPNPSAIMFQQSDRGIGSHYGYLAAAAFTSKFKLKSIIRAHQFIESGIKYNFDNLVITVFSASNYSQENPNPSCFLQIRQTDHIDPILLLSIPFLERKNAHFVNIRQYIPVAVQLRIMRSISNCVRTRCPRGLALAGSMSSIKLANFNKICSTVNDLRTITETF